MKKFYSFLIGAFFLSALFTTNSVLGQIAQRGTSTNGTSTNTSLTINKPALVAQGDVMIVNIAKDGNAIDASLSGWTPLASGSINGGNIRATLLWKVATSSEPASYTFALGAGSSDAVGSIVAFYNVDVSGPTPFDVVGSIGLSLANGQTATAPGITTASANTGVVMFAQQSDNKTFTNYTTTSPGNLTEVYEDQYNSNNQDLTVGAAFAVKASAGATGNGTVTLQDNNDRWGAILVALKYQVPAPSATLTPSTSQNVAVGGSISFTATPSNFTGSGNHTYTWTAVGATIPPTNPISAGASNTKLLVFPTAGTYTVQVSITRGTTTLSTNTTTVNVLSAPASPNLWGISGTNVVNFTVNGGIDFGAGPTTRFAQSVGTNSAALARTDAPSQVNGYFYWLLNSQNNGGVVQVYGSDAAGGSQILIGSLDVNGAGTNSLGFVRLGARADGVVYGLAGDGTTIYLFKFKPNGVTANASLPAADRLVVEDASVTLVGGAAATFQNGDICLAGDGNMVALANDGSGLTQIFTGTPNGANTTLTKKFDVLPVGGQTFTGSVNGVAFDLQGSLYVSTTGGTGDGLYYINKNTVNGPAGTINISQVWAGSGLTDLASNFFPFTIVTPVKMASFSVKKLGNNAILDWTTVTELNSDHFDIERSYDGVNFEKVGSKQGAGNSTSDISYQFADPILVNKGIIYYRLRSVDIDMHAEYSAIVILKLNGGSLKNVSVFPNPFRSDLKVQLNSDHATVATLRISNMAGQVLVNRSVNLQKGDNVFVLTSELQNLAAGVHVLELISDDQRINQTIIKK